MISENISSLLDKEREKAGFYKIEELIQIINKGNVIFDPYSTLISINANIGVGNTFFPTTCFQIRNNGLITIGNNNIFFPNSFVLADYGEISIGNENIIGEGGISFKVNKLDSFITIGNKGRYIRGPEVLGTTKLESGTQIIGPIRVQDCILYKGMSFLSENPDLRGGVLKGYGLARNLKVKKGEVINGNGVFEMGNIMRQTFFHP